MFSYHLNSEKEKNAGGRKEREKRRQGWTHTKALNVCIVSYSLVVADAHIFKRKLWLVVNYVTERKHN
jgi:hypothetical protein